MFKNKFLLIFWLWLLLTGPGQADNRRYVWTYEYQTMPPGAYEVEYYLTVEQKQLDQPASSTWQHQVELETGITDQLDIGIYQQFKQSNSRGANTFKYEGFKARVRYQIGEKDQYLADPLIYLEYIRSAHLEQPAVLEAKLILAKDFGNFNISYNQIIEQQLATGAAAEHEYALGFSQKITSDFKVGLEGTGNFTENKYYAGPTVAWWGDNIWVGAGVLRGLNGNSDDLRIRVLVGKLF